MRARLAVLLLLASACPPKDPPTGDTGEDTGDSTTTSGSPTTPITTGPEGTTAADDLTGDSLCGGGDCDRFVERLFACELEGNFDGCPCDGGMTGEKCVAAWQTVADCFEATSCEVLSTGEGECWTAFNSAYEQCLFGEDGCELRFLLDLTPDDDNCGFGEECLDQPSRELVCAGDTCECRIDDKLAATCPADGVCPDLDLQTVEKITACCGQ